MPRSLGFTTKMPRPLILNLGCGTRTHPACVNIDWSIHLRLRRLRLGWLGGSRAAAIAALSDNIIVHDLRRGIPFADSSVDAVYHSHVLEHIDRDEAPTFMKEILRVLKPGGIQRVVVPEFSHMARDYLERFGEPGHEDRMAYMFEQSVRREAAGTRAQRGFRRRIENAVLGDARRRGETHQWVYDEVNLGDLLSGAGFVRPRVVDHDTSAIPGWAEIALDTLNGTPVHDGSLYMEANRP